MLNRQFKGKDNFLIYIIFITIFSLAVLLEANFIFHSVLFSLILLSSNAANTMPEPQIMIWLHHLILTVVLSFQTGLTNWQFLAVEVSQVFWMVKPYLALAFLATSASKEIFNTHHQLTQNAILLYNILRVLCVLCFCWVFYSFNPLLAGVKAITISEQVLVSLVLYTQNLISFSVSCYILGWPSNSFLGTKNISIHSIFITVVLSFCFVALQYHSLFLFQPLIVSYHINQYTLSTLLEHYWGAIVQLIMSCHWDQIILRLIPYQVLLLNKYAKPQEQSISHWSKFWSAFPPAIIMVFLTHGVIRVNPFLSLELFNQFFCSISQNIILNLLFIWSNNIYIGWTVQFLSGAITSFTSYDHQSGFGVYQEQYVLSELTVSQQLESNIALWLAQSVMAYGLTRIIPEDDRQESRATV